MARKRAANVFVAKADVAALSDSSDEDEDEDSEYVETSTRRFSSGLGQGPSSGTRGGCNNRSAKEAARPRHRQSSATASAGNRGSVRSSAAMATAPSLAGAAVDYGQAYPYVVFQAKDKNNVLFVHVRLELPSDVTSNMIVCNIDDDGMSVQVTVKKPIYDALLDPDFLLMKYAAASGGFSASHPLYQSLASVRRAYAESKEHQERSVRVVRIALPFRCDPSRFYDPPRNSKDPRAGPELGVYPLDVDKHLGGGPLPPGAPPPSVSFLTFACRGIRMKRAAQKVQGSSYMPTA